MVATTPSSTYSHTAVPQLASGAPYTHHSQLHLRTYRLSGSQKVCEWALSSTATSSCPCFDDHLCSQKEAAGWKDRDIRTCSKCTPVAVTAHSDWMQLAVLIIAAVYLLRESHSTVQTTSLLTRFTLTHTSTCTVCIYVLYLSDGEVLMHDSAFNGHLMQSQLVNRCKCSTFNG